MLPIIYSVRARNDIAGIRRYLLNKFTQREVDNFFELIKDFEAVVIDHPELFVKSSLNTNAHRAVLSKKLSVFYKVSKKRIFVAAVLDNRMNPKRWP